MTVTCQGCKYGYGTANKWACQSQRGHGAASMVAESQGRTWERGHSRCISSAGLRAVCVLGEGVLAVWAYLWPLLTSACSLCTHRLQQPKGTAHSSLDFYPAVQTGRRLIRVSVGISCCQRHRELLQGVTEHLPSVWLSSSCRHQSVQWHTAPWAGDPPTPVPFPYGTSSIPIASPACFSHQCPVVPCARLSRAQHWAQPLL